ncbi:MAG: glycogen/starch synthase [Nanobdellota archaeon]
MFECSWEVCNKVGGIYTVVKSKAGLMKKNYTNYFLIGPYFEDKANIELEEKEPPEQLKEIFKKLEKEGIVCHFGTWNIEAEPNVILIDARNFAENKDSIKKNLWEHFGVDSISSGWDFEEPMVWATAAGKLIDHFHKEDTVAHFHEWMAGFAGLYLKMQKTNIATVFTTHATILGRSIAGVGEDLYKNLEKIDPESEAKKKGITDKFTAERACAKNAEIFTTVSEITAMEAEKFLGRKPEVLVLNGLTIDEFPTFEETSIKHNYNRDLIREFLSYYFLPYYNINLDENLIYFIVGRYEFRNKGLDILTKSLGKLNQKLKDEGSERTISVFYWIPGSAKGIKKDLLENKTFYRHIRNYVSRNSEEFQKKIIKTILSQEPLDNEHLFSKEFKRNNKKHLKGFKREGLPPLTTHYLEEGEENNEVIKAFKKEGLLNRQEDKVKVIFYPVYLNGVDGLIDLPYYDCIMGSHLGLFPSYYEPWGYTPLESAALGVPAITTDLAGFGKFISKDSRTNKKGMFVLKRHGKDDPTEEFTKMLYDYSQLDRHSRVENKMAVKNIAGLADWKELIKNYIKAHNLALKKCRN